MFFTIGLAIYLPCVIYILFRMRNLLKNHRHKNLLFVFVTLLVLAFPAGRLFFFHGGDRWTEYVALPCYYSLPYLLYFFLWLILSDLVIGLCRLSRLLSKATVERPNFKRIRILTVFIVPLFIVIYGIVNYNNIRINEYTIDVPRKSSKLNRLNIAFVADLHLNINPDARFLEKFVMKLNAVDPDIVLICGDLFEGDHEEESTTAIANRFRQIHAKYGVYAVLGNHEMHGRIDRKFFIDSGIRLLEDKVETVDGAFHLAGRIDSRSNNRKSLVELLQGIPEDLPVILMDHRPIDLANLDQSKVDIQVSGHTHHGQLFPFNLLTEHIYEVSWGHIMKGHTHIFVTSGVQTWGPPVRTAGDSEIGVIHVIFREGD
jgi:hypothetical protein